MPRGRGTFPENTLAQEAPLFCPSLPNLHLREELFTSLQHPFITSIASPHLLPSEQANSPFTQLSGRGRPVKCRSEGRGSLRSSSRRLCEPAKVAPESPLPPPSAGFSPAAQGTSLLQVETGLPTSPLSSRALNRINEREHSKHCSERCQNRQLATSSQAAILDWFPRQLLLDFERGLLHSAIPALLGI